MKNTFNLISRNNRSPLPPELKKSIGSFLFKNIFKTPNSFQLNHFKFEIPNYNSFIYMFEEIFINANYFFNIKKKDPVIIDCGSNTGLSILFFKQLYPKSKIIAFEPDPNTFTILERNINLNKLNNITLYNVALDNEISQKTFYTNKTNPASGVSSLIANRANKDEIKVETVKLSSYIESKIDLLKLDIEGSEFAVIEDLHETGKLNFIDKMIIEYHHHINKSEDRLSELLKILEQSNFGYQIESKMNYPLRGRKFQDILIYSYKKGFLN